MRVGCLIAASSVLFAACSTIHRIPRPDLPPSERGATEMRDLLDSFAGAIEDGKFDLAQEMIEELEEGIKNAEPTLIMHWDYGRISERAGDAQRVLANARRDHALALLIDATERELIAADALLTKLVDEGPNEWRLERLDEIHDALDDLTAEGRAFNKEERYAPVRARLRASVEALGHAQPGYAWLLELGVDLEDALAVVNEELTTETAEQIDQAQRMVAAFAACGEIIAQYAKEKGQDPDLDITTPLGRFTVAQTVEVCANEHKSTEDHLVHLRWRRSMEDTATWVSDTLKSIEKEKSPVAILGANERAVQTLAACEQRLADVESAPGYVDTMTFPSHIGKLTAPRLREKCSEVRGRLVELQPTLRWRSAAAGLRATIQKVRDKTAKAKQASVEKLEELRRGFQKCNERATALVAISDPLWRDAKPSRRDIKAMAKLASACKGEQAYIERLAEKAKAKAGASTSKSRSKSKSKAR